MAAAEGTRRRPGRPRGRDGQAVSGVSGRRRGRPGPAGKGLLGERPRRGVRAGAAGVPAGLGEAFFEPIEAAAPRAPDPGLINEDFQPTLAADRTFSAADMAALWVGLVVCVPTWYLAGGLVEMGMSWLQGIATVFVGNLICLAPVLLNAQPGTKYGIPFPVLSRAVFGIYGANIPSVLRGVVACGWFGIQTYVGGNSMMSITETVLGTKFDTASPLAGLGISAPELLFFGLFWSIQVAVLVRGMESIRIVEKYSAPVLIGLCAALLLWAVSAAGGFGPMLSAPSQFAAGMPKAGQFLGAFVPAVTAQVGFWATLSLNIPDFTRFAKSQKSQLVGQMIGLPVFMAAFTFIGLAVTSATQVIFGQTISDPVAICSRLSGGATAFALVGLMLATLSTNIAANIVGPANAMVNLRPQNISFKGGAVLTAVLGALLQPWRLIKSTEGFIFTWLIGYSALLGPIVGIMIVDYYLKQGRVLDIDALYTAGPGGRYWFTGGYNLRALLSLACGALLNVPGFLDVCGVLKANAFFQSIYSAAWFTGTLTAGAIYWALLKLPHRSSSRAS